MEILRFFDFVAKSGCPSHAQQTQGKEKFHHAPSSSVKKKKERETQLIGS